MNLIIGGTGFIGGHLAEYFFQQGEISRAVFRKGAHLRTLDQCGVQNLEGDLLQRETLHEPLEGVETVYNLVSGMPHDDSPDDYVKANSEGLRNLLEESREHGVKTIAHLSTLDVYGLRKRTIDENSRPEPSHPYQRAKLEGERILLEFASSNPEIKVRIIRAARAVGSRDTTLVLPLVAMAERGEIVLPPGSSERISLSHPKDIAQALQKSAAGESRRALYLVKSFDSSVEELAKTISESCGKAVKVRGQGLFGKSPLPKYTAEQIRGGLLLKDQESWKTIGYAPSYDLQKVGAEVAEWYRREPWITRESRT